MMKQEKILYGGLPSLNRELRRADYCDSKFVVLLDEHTFSLCLPQLVASVEALQEAEFIEVPVGEECKSLEVAAQVWQTLLEGGADRRAVLVCLGGGAVCDLGGFVAAGYKRGIRHINVPTTLLAMVDAAIGGKTAIDFCGVKNSIGHFYPASVTCIEPAFLDSLPPEESLNGQMEMVKTAAVTDQKLFSQLISNNSQFTIHNSQMKEVARIKACVVKADPYDHGIRRILNFGHTFGHAVEVYRQLPHGIAVGIGMRAAMYLSVKKLGLGEATYGAYCSWLDARLSEAGMQRPVFDLKAAERLIALMHNDKKNALDSTRCVLLRAPGEPVIDVEVSDNELRDAYLKLGR